MELLDNLRRQFTYDRWANREVLDGLLRNPPSTERPLQLLAHIVSAERLWFQRIQGEPQTFPVWPDFSLEQCETQMAELASLWQGYLSGISPETLSGKVSYKNTKGEEWTDTVQDILTHVVLHSAYHRGQIAILMRADGQQPAYTDFIHAKRQGFIE